MKRLMLNEFLDRSDDFINNAAIGDEFYSIQTNSGNAIVISEREFNALAEAAKYVKSNYNK